MEIRDRCENWVSGNSTYMVNTVHVYWFNQFKLTDKSISDQNGECFAREINPLNLTTRPGAPEPLENLEINPFLTTGKLSVSSNEKTHNETRRKYVEYSSSSSYTSSNKVRRKRDEDAVKAEAYTDRKHVINLVSDKIPLLYIYGFIIQYTFTSRAYQSLLYTY